MFFVNLKLENDKKESFRIDGEDVQAISFSTFCRWCGKEIEIEEDEFYAMAIKDGYYGSVWYCYKDCADKAKSRQDFENAGFEIIKCKT
jgi:hypothetical protein